MTMNEKIARTYTLTEKHIKMLDELSKKEERTASGIVRLAIEHYYQRDQNEK